MTNKIVFTLLLLLLLLSCSHKKEGSKNESILKINVDPLQSTDKDLTDILKNIRYIQLETSSNCLLNSISKIEIEKEKIFIFTSGRNGNLFCFDLNGKYLFSVGSQGNGPGEYVFLTDFYIDRKLNCIWVGDDARKILKYDLSGNFIEQYKVDFSINNLFPLPDDSESMAIRLGYYKDKNYSFVIYNLRENKITYAKEQIYEIERIVAQSSFFENRKDILYGAVFNDTIFRLSKEGLEPHILIDFGKYTFSREKLGEKDSKQVIAEFLNPKNKYAGFVGAVYENSDFISFRYDFADERFLAIYSKKEKQTVSINKIRIENQAFDAGMHFLQSYRQGQYISSLPAHLLYEDEQIVENTQKRSYGHYTSLKELKSNITEDSNPILIIGEEKAVSLQ